MMKWMNQIGTDLYDALLITVVVSVSFILVIPFIPIVVGVQAYYQHERNERRLRLILTTLYENRRLIARYTLFTLGTLGVATLNIAYFSPLITTGHGIFVGVNWVVIGIVALSFIYAPMVIIMMKVTLRQLLFNAWMAALTQPLQLMVMVMAYGVLGVVVVIAPAFTPLGFAPVFALVAQLTHRHLVNLSTPSL